MPGPGGAVPRIGASIDRPGSGGVVFRTSREPSDAVSWIVGKHKQAGLRGRSFQGQLDTGGAVSGPAGHRWRSCVGNGSELAGAGRRIRHGQGMASASGSYIWI